MTEAAPIACSLDATDLSDRLRWIAGLNTRALKSSHRDDLTLTLDYDPNALADVRKMVAGEQTCCAFLRFDVAEQPDMVRVTIEAPEEARGAADTLFEPFASRVASIGPKPCGCVSECGA